MNISAQAIVIDQEGKIYLEDNQVTRMLSFIWGKQKWKETFEEIIIRETKEELGIVLPESRFLNGQEQPERKFWNERLQDYISWFSKYFVLILTPSEVKDIKWSVKLVVLENKRDLEKFPEEKFWPLGREVFTAQIERALSHIS